ncbi:MAG TPA: hypothetical protein PKJ94_14780, partial [Ferruginibacter sp.]|nr:hypothetical protein [Ferruginibacter sp.]
MSIVSSLQKSTIESLSALFSQSFTEKDFQVNQTKPEFEGDYTVVMFSLVKSLKLSPDAIGNQLLLEDAATHVEHAEDVRR